MYVYFDEHGTLKEIVSDKKFRVGDSKRDKIYVYWEGEHTAYSGWIKYRKPNGKDTTEECFFQLGDSLVGKQLPNKPLRNLKYFSYDHTYEKDGAEHIGYLFYEITVPDEVLNSSADEEEIPSENNMITARIRFVLNEGAETNPDIDDFDTIATMGALVFSVEENIGILTDSSINKTQYNYLLKLISSKIGFGIKSEIVSALPESGVSGTIYYKVVNQGGIMYEAYIWNGDEWVFLGTTTYSLYTKQEGEDFELAIQTLWNAEMEDYEATMNSNFESLSDDIQEELSNLSAFIRSAASGSPKGIYSTYQALQTANPDHNYIYLVLADGKWYYWSNNTWTEGGTYLSSLPDSKLSNTSDNSVQNKVVTKAITDANLNAVNNAFRVDLKDDADWTQGKYWSAGGVQSTYASYFCTEIDISRYVGKNIDLLMGNKYSYKEYCFIKLNDNTYIPVPAQKFLVKENYASLELSYDNNSLTENNKTPYCYVTNSYLEEEKVLSKNLLVFNAYDWTQGKYWSAGGVQSSHNSYKCSEVNVSQYRGLCAKVSFGYKDPNNVIRPTDYCFVKFENGTYDNLGNYIIENNQKKQYAIVLIPNGAETFQLSYDTGASDVGYDNSPYLAFEYQLKARDNDSFIFEDYDWTYGKYWSAGGVQSANASYLCSEFSIVDFRGKMVKVSFGYKLTSLRPVDYCFIKLSNDTYASLSDYVLSTDNVNNYALVLIPNNAVLLEVSYDANTSGGYYSPAPRFEVLLSQNKEKASGLKIMLYGDSIFSTDYSWLKDYLSKMTNSAVYNGGFSGYNASSLASSTCLQRAINYNPDVVIIMVGGNDVGAAGSVGTFGTYGGLLANESVKSLPNIENAYAGSSFIEAVAYIANYLTYKIAGFRHNKHLEGGCTDVGNNLSSETDLDNTRKPVVILCSTLPQQRYDNTSSFSDPKNSKRKADACREVAQLCNIPFIDLAVLSGLSRVNEPYWQSPTDMVHNKGTLTMDGLHPNKYGYYRIAKILAKYIDMYYSLDMKMID